MQHFLIILICFLPVSGAFWAEENATGVVGRTVTIYCYYDKQRYESYRKYWCHKWYRTSCTTVVDTNMQIGWQGRVSIKDYTTQGIFAVTMKNLTSADTGWYNCGIKRTGFDPMFAVYLQISDVIVSEPLLKFVHPSNVLCIGGPVSVLCESLKGSLPITYAWYKKMQSTDSKISQSNNLHLYCKHISEDQQYYCTASNNKGTTASEMLKVSLVKAAEKDCRFLVQINKTGNMLYTCEDFPINTDMKPDRTNELTTIHESTSHATAVVDDCYVIWNWLRWILFAFLLICAISGTWWTKKN